MRMRAEKNRQICIDNRLRAVRVVHPGRDGIIFSLNKSINIPAERINIRTIRTERFGQQRHDVRASLIIRPKERSGESSRHARERNQSTQKGSSVAGTSSKRPARLRDFSRLSRIVAQSRDDSERLRERDCLVDSRRHAPSAEAKINGVL